MPFSPRKPILVIEDHVYHVSEILQALHQRNPDWLELTTVLCLDRPGPDTSRAVASWLTSYPGVHIGTAANEGLSPALPHEQDRQRLIVLEESVFQNQNRFCKKVAALLRPQGLLIQDIQLETLAFVNQQDWWETIFLASAVRGMFADRPPACRFMSNKSGFGISFGRELMEAGFDPRQVIDKEQLGQLIGSVVGDYLQDSLPLVLEILKPDQEPGTTYVSEQDRAHLDQALDLVIWEGDEHVDLGGRLVKRKKNALRTKAQEAETWKRLVADRFHAGEGITVDEVGQRIAPEDAGRAERTNSAARHLHTLRARLTQGDAILTANSCYRLGRSLTIGRVRARPGEWF